MAFFKLNSPPGLLAIAILLRWLVAQFPHSGQGQPPMFGDYEAQRHWMEVTTNLPVTQWYENSTDNDLLYWGLDYPPLSAYHMYMLGKISEKLNSSWTQLHHSRGIETHEHKLFMRATVLIADVTIYMSGLVYFFYKTHPVFHAKAPSDHHKFNTAIYTAMALLSPAQILIDHGHFQYNCFFLGLVVWAVIFMIKGRVALASILYTLALTYKQMSLYYSLPFFWFIMSINLRRRPFSLMFKHIIGTGVVVVITLLVIFSPYVHDIQSFTQVLNRVFPFNRGLFEDKVANLWFVINIVYKMRQIYSLAELLRASTILTVIASLPAGIHLLIKPSLASFKYALVNTSLAFFLFSFQVHEKTILLPALPILLLYREHPMAVNWFNVISTFSLQPLLLRDGQTVPYFALMTLYILMILELFSKQIVMSSTKIICWTNLKIVSYLCSIIGCITLSTLAVTYVPPTRYPDLHQVFNSVYSCIHFVAFLLFFYQRQFRVGEKLGKTVDTVYLIKKTD